MKEKPGACISVLLSKGTKIPSDGHISIGSTYTFRTNVLRRLYMLADANFKQTSTKKEKEFAEHVLQLIVHVSIDAIDFVFYKMSPSLRPVSSLYLFLD